ncbi:hypothetical protein RJ641_022739 [Dillenia turbinata]|uniref:Uncharacterized protein n=1 Tax=Dillenia turbinata TaxID=194707 RepID=A0AAN8UM87_9MAGN
MTLKLHARNIAISSMLSGGTAYQSRLTELSLAVKAISASVLPILFKKFEFCNEYAVSKDKLDNFKDVAPQDIICSQVVYLSCYFPVHDYKKWGVILREEDVAVCNVRIDLTRGRRNPLERVNLEEGSKAIDWQHEKALRFERSRLNSVDNETDSDLDYESKEKFYVHDDSVGAISEAFENFQLKTYGIKAQVHATPEKKRRRI